MWGWWWRTALQFAKVYDTKVGAYYYVNRLTYEVRRVSSTLCFHTFSSLFRLNYRAGNLRPLLIRRRHGSCQQCFTGKTSRFSLGCSGTQKRCESSSLPLALVTCLRCCADISRKMKPRQAAVIIQTSWRRHMQCHTLHRLALEVYRKARCRYSAEC